MDFLEGLVCLNPERRYSCEEALSHDFFHSDPKPCKPGEIRKLDIEYHEMKAS